MREIVEETQLPTLKHMVLVAEVKEIFFNKPFVSKSRG